MSKAESRPGPNVLLSLAENPDSASVCWLFRVPVGVSGAPVS